MICPGWAGSVSCSRWLHWTYFTPWTLTFPPYAPDPRWKHRLHSSCHVGHREREICRCICDSDQQPTVGVCCQPSGVSTKAQRSTLINLHVFNWPSVYALVLENNGQEKMISAISTDLIRQIGWGSISHLCSSLSLTFNFFNGIVNWPVHSSCNVR